MKNILKKICAVLSAAAMTVTCITAMPFVAAAEGETAAERDIQYSHIEFINGTDSEQDETVSARTFIRDLSGDTTPVSLFCATYDSENNLVGASVTSGMNEVMATNWYKTGNNKKTVAYIWDKNTLAPISNIAKKDLPATEVVPEITFDGKSFKDYIGEDFSLSKVEYNVELKDNFITGQVKWPKICVKLSDNSATYQVIDNEAELSSTIRIYAGSRNTTSEEISGAGSKATRYHYSWDYKDYTIKYTLPSGSFMDKSLVRDTAGQDLYGGEIFWTNKYTTTVTKDESETVKKVSFTINGFWKQDAVLIVKPLNGEDKNVISTADGTALTWARSQSAGRTGYNENSGSSIYGEISQQTPVKVVKKDNSTTNIRVFRSIEASDNEFKSGSTVDADRNPADGQIALGYLADDLSGYHYIPLPGNTVQDKATLEFYVNQSVQLIWISSNSNLTFDDTYTWNHATAATSADAELAKQNTTLKSWTKCFATSRWLNLFSMWSAAKAVRELGVSENQFTQRGNYTYNGQSYKAYIALKWNDFFNIHNKIGNKSYVPASADSAAAKVTDLRSAVDGWRTANDNINEYDVVKDAKMDYQESGVPSLAVKNFPISNTDGIFTDRYPFKENANGYAAKTGALLGYTDALELDGTKLISPAIGWRNDNQQYATDYTTTIQNWYSFIAKDDCEVMIISDKAIEALSNNAWIKIASSNDGVGVDLAINLSTEKPEVKTYSNMYVKRFAAGEKVQIQSPGTAVNMLTFVRHLPEEITESSETAKGIDTVQITVNGSLNADYTQKANNIQKLKVNDGTNLGSQIAYNRNYPANATYTNDVREICDKYKNLLGSDYIMCAGGAEENAGYGYETSFVLHKDATVLVFISGQNGNGEGVANKQKANEYGWTFEGNTDKPYMKYQLNNSMAFTQVLTKHFTLNDKKGGDKITIPKDMLYSDVAKSYGVNTMTVVYYD